MSDQDTGGGTDRNETPSERADRNWTDLLQEFRVLQTGVQLLSGFLLTLPFHSTFEDLDTIQKRTYLLLVVLAASTTAVLLTPIAVHRQIFRRQRKQQLVQIGHVLARVVLVLIGAVVAGTTFFIFDVVADRTSAVAVGALMLALVTSALVVAPLATSATVGQGNAAAPAEEPTEQPQHTLRAQRADSATETPEGS